MQKTMLISILVFSTSLFANTQYADIQVTQISPVPEQAIWQRSTHVSPKYPVKLAMNGVVGCAVYNVAISEQGKTQAIKLISQVSTKNSLAKEGRKIIKKFAWQPQPDQIAKASEQVIRLDFCMGGDSLEASEARCKQQTQFSCQKDTNS
ncbi:energy transducer TonB [Pseudoalteromonas ulvae]|nr:energy transducer TonB [Pseudoalteromonas ulvae]